MDMLAEVKKRLQITNDYMDDMLNGYIEDSIAYLRRAGVPDSLIETAYGVVSKGVFDMWTRSSFSDIFYDMATQLALSK